jgi:cytochrome oxidase assembly protein ShyY1
MMPLVLEDQKKVLWINRGWAPRNSLNRVELPIISTPDTTVVIDGVGFPHPGRVYELGQQTEAVSKPRIEQNVETRHAGEHPPQQKCRVDNVIEQHHA